MSASPAVDRTGDRAGRKNADDLRRGLRPFAWGPTPESRRRVQECGRRAIGLPGIWNAREAAAEGKRHAHWKNVARCGRRWSCPTCALIITAHDAAEVTEAVNVWGQRRCELVTYTMKHATGDKLVELLWGLANAYRRMTGGRPWELLCEKFGVRHYVRGVEMTHGKNGHHPHLHVIYALERELSAADRSALNDELSVLWATMVVRELGLEHLPTDWAGVKVTPLHRSDYLSKLGMEIAAPPSTKGASNGNRTPWQVARELVRDGLADDADYWHEYSVATYRRKQLTWSKDFREAVGLGQEKTDEQIVNQEERGDVPVYECPNRVTWQCIRDSHGGRGPRMLLDAWERSDAEFWALLETIFAAYDEVQQASGFS